MMTALPSWAERLLKAACPDDLYEQIEGDLIEMYNYELKTHGKRKAKLSFILKVVRFVRPGIISRRKNRHAGYTPMFMHNMKSAFRAMRRDKLFSSINISGLAIGIAASVLIIAWVQYQYSYNHFIGNYREIHQVKINFSYNGEVVTDVANPLPLYYALQEADARIKDVCFTSNTYGHTLAVDDKKIYKEVLLASKEFLTMFDIPLIKGDFHSLDDPHSIMLNESTAKEFFGDADPMGQFIRFDNQTDMKVTGIYKDVPYNSDFWFMAIAPTAWDDNWLKNDRDKWDEFYPHIYLRLHDNSQAAEVNASIKDLVKKNFDDGSHPELYLHQLERWHLYDHFENGQEAGGKIEYVKLFTWIAALILLIACINYINLSTARSERRAREVGIRKTIGSRKFQLVQQFMTESFMSTAIALVVALVLVGLALPYYNSLVHARVEMSFESADIWIAAIAIFGVTTILAGFYPAFFFSSRRPIDVLRGGNTKRSAGLSRKALVVSQFSIAIFLAIGVVVIYQQIEFARNRNLGYDQNDLVSVPMNLQIEKNYNAIKNELLATGVVESVTLSNEGIDADYFNDYVEWPGMMNKDKILFSRVSVKDDFVKTMKMEIVAGRDFSPLMKADTASILINEAAVKIMGLKDPIGEKIKTRSGPLTIIGVTKDVVRGSPFSRVQPCYIGMLGDYNNHLTMRVTKAGDVATTLSKVHDVFRKLDPLNPVDSWYVNDNWNYNFRDIRSVGELGRIFAGLAIFLTCLGVVGLAAYTAEQKTKEIAIRKVLGATVTSVIMLFSNYFVRAAVLSVIISAPIAWFALDSYLEDYYYRIDVPWWVIPSTAAGMLLFTLIIVFVQTFRVARANPVLGLKRE